MGVDKLASIHRPNGMSTCRPMSERRFPVMDAPSLPAGHAMLPMGLVPNPNMPAHLLRRRMRRMFFTSNR